MAKRAQTKTPNKNASRQHEVQGPLLRPTYLKPASRIKLRLCVCGVHAQ